MEEDTSGLTFQEWTSDVNTSRPPVDMLINSSELRTTGFKVKEVFPPSLETVVRGGFRTEEQDCEVLRVWTLKGLFCQEYILRDTDNRSTHFLLISKLIKHTTCSDFDDLSSRGYRPRVPRDRDTEIDIRDLSSKGV